MDRNKKKIISIGGGGFTNETDESLDQFVLNQVNIKNFKIGFLPTASKDDQKKIDLFYKRFDSNYLQLSHFNLCSKVEGFKDWILSKDIIYVGGGNTSYMLEIWKKNNLIEIFREAYNKGIILSGVSAGAICWFDWILSDSEGIGLKALRGINLISGSCTPHSSENERLKKFKNDIENSEMPKGIAIDDGVGVLFIDGKPSEVYSSRKNHDAYFIDKNKKISLKEHIKNSL